jgi:phage-related minor tail protein
LLEAEKAAIRLAAVDVASNIAAGADEAARLTQTLYDAVAAFNIASARGNMQYSGRGGDPRDFMNGPGNPQNNTFAGSTYTPPARRSGGGGGGSGRESDMQRTAKKLFDDTRTAAEKYKIALQELDAVYASGAISAEVYERKQAQLKEQFENAGSFAKSVAGTVKSSMDGLFNSIFEGGGKAGEAIEGLGKKLAAMALQQSTYSLLARLLPGTFGAGGFIPLLANAKGNAFDGGKVTAFARGGIVGGPTMFGMRGGMGLMGEAGPEAIMPLTRIGGKLGVASQRGGGTVVQIIDQRRSGADIEQRTERGPDGREFVTMVVKDAQSRGELDGSTRQRFGSPVQKVRR